MARRVADHREQERTWLKRLTDGLLGVLAHCILTSVGLLNKQTASNLGGWLGRNVGPWIGVSKTAKNNLRLAFPDWSEEQLNQTVRAVWDNFGRTVFEFPHLPAFTCDGPNPDIEVIGVDIIERLRDDGLPGFFFSAHLANWEVLALTALHHGIDLDLIYRAPNNPMVEDLLQKRHPGNGELIPKGPSGARRLLTRLSAGKHFGIMIDQKMNDGISIPLFGRPAMTAPGLAQLAFKSDCPVVPSRVTRLGAARFRVIIEEPLKFNRSADKQADIEAAMIRVNVILESWIRERPGEWLWLHNRWPR